MQLHLNKYFGKHQVINNEFESNQQNQIRSGSASSNETDETTDPRKNSKIRISCHLCFAGNENTMTEYVEVFWMVMAQYTNIYSRFTSSKMHC